MNKEPRVFLRNYDYKGLRKNRRKRRLAMLQLLLQASDTNYLVDPTEEIFNIPYNPAEISPMGILDGMYPQEDLEDKPAGNLYYGVSDTHWFPADDGEIEENDGKSKSKSKA